MTRLFFLFSCLFVLLLYACDDDDLGQITNPFENCCNTPYEQLLLDSVKIYIPNAFSPNDDGINDRFLAYGNANNFDLSVDSLWITDLVGNLIFESANTYLGDFSKGWDGQISPNQPYLGEFRFGMKMTKRNDPTVIFEGKACSIPCGEATDPFDLSGFLDCYWGTQHNGEGGFDPNADHMEDDCL